MANQTLGGEALDRALRDRLHEDHSSVFYVLIPTVEVEHEATTWTGGFVLDVPATMFAANRRDHQNGARRDEVLEEGRGRAQHRLDRMVAKVELAGGRPRARSGRRTR